MKTCTQCKKLLRVGDEVHVVDDQIFCSDECAIVYLTNDIICSAKEAAKELYNEAASILTLRPSGLPETCEVCGKDLSTCKTIWAAEGMLYCSRKCGIHNYTLSDNDSEYAAEIFGLVAEEINPKDIGLEVQE